MNETIGNNTNEEIEKVFFDVFKRLTIETHNQKISSGPKARNHSHCNTAQEC